MFITKLIITNSANDSERVEWFYTLSEVVKENWIKEKNEEKIAWNTNKDSGRNSVRYYDFTNYTKEEFLNLTFNELEGLKIKDFYNILIL